MHRLGCGIPFLIVFESGITLRLDSPTFGNPCSGCGIPTLEAFEEHIGCFSFFCECGYSAHLRTDNLVEVQGGEFFDSFAISRFVYEHFTVTIEVAHFYFLACGMTCGEGVGYFKRHLCHGSG